MRCSKCHCRMDEEIKDTFFRGTLVVNRCKRCENEIVVHKGDSLFSNIIHFKRNAIEVDHRTARSIDMH